MGRTDAVQFVLECVKVWRELGATVTFEPGFEVRGNGMSANYDGGVVHHTASNSSASTPFPTRNILINGRPDLQGPLCNVAGPWCLASSPALHVIAAHPANHAGASGGRSMGPLPVTNLFNPRVLGLEIDYPGTSPMTAGQYRAALIFTAGVSRVLGRPSVEWVRGHAETSITGKWDPGYANGKTIDLAAFRRDSLTLMGDDMFTDADRALIQRLATKADLGFARDQICAGIGVDKDAAPPELTPTEIQARAVGRRVDVGFARDQIMGRLADIEAALTALSNAHSTTVASTPPQP